MNNNVVALETAQSSKALESSWVRDAKNGDVRAFEHLYRTHEKKVYALCLRMCAQVGLAEELTQEAFIKAWRSLAQFRGDSQFGTWLYRLTSNTVISYFRKANLLVFDENIMEEVLELRPGPEVLGEQRDLENAISQLPEKARMIFVLHDVQGYAHNEIADMLDCAVGTSKAQLHRARQLLKGWLNYE
ncbi:RNA polymerase sigma factor [Pleionea sp. CnH1-48]|uniref:RNA polymerase sigma factor n=1 Tax=Pleionea sp. CnH1-48 TaxID=2954494 RepID=UPI0020973DDE|nr:sigma-70 family RNA polymerase sigma factor [Pleionea sp. CnH1-48]MCO7226433.1 sigma-70 family RNA polymerase sigma factor [Pleionea sp. CnH1-48]